MIGNGNENEIDSDLVRRLAELLEETGLSELEYEAEGLRIRVARQLPMAVVAAGTEAPSGEGDDADPGGAAAETDASHPGAVISPMVGTAYSAPQPDAPPFVNVGDRVEKGQTLLVIEAMKVMNPIAAPRGGTVRRILYENGQPVEFGDVLAILD